MSLPNDVSRCAGVGDKKDGFREGCEDCLRRTDAGTGEYVSHMQPPIIIAFECAFRISPRIEK